MTSLVIEDVHQNHIAVVALPALTSDSLNPSDVSVFSAMKRYAKEKDEQINIKQQRYCANQVYMISLAILNTINQAHDAALSKQNIKYGSRNSSTRPL